MTAPSLVAWVRWIVPPAGSAVGVVERLPRVLAEVFVSRGDAVEVPEADVPLALRRRRPS